MHHEKPGRLRVSRREEKGGEEENLTLDKGMSNGPIQNSDPNVQRRSGPDMARTVRPAANPFDSVFVKI
jgi:hypothetical protein